MNVAVVPMDNNRIVTGQTVVIRARRITAIGSRRETSVPQGALVIDGTGQYLIPGLIDAHVHLNRPEDVNRELLPLFLAAGVTTVLNLSGNQAILRVREQIRAGVVAGPRVFTSGPYIGSDIAVHPVSPKQIEALARDHKRAGYDFIKLHGALSLEAYRRLMEIARQERIRVIGHVPRNLGLAPVVKERQHAIAHVEEFLYAHYYYQRSTEETPPNVDASVTELASQVAKAGIAVISTLSVFKGISAQIRDLDGVLRRPEARYVPDRVKAAWGWLPPQNTYVLRFPKEKLAWFDRQYQLMKRTIDAMRLAGVLVVSGTDSPTSVVVPGFSMHEELQNLVEAGLPPYVALRAATIDAARFLGVSSESGTIAIGRRADLVMLQHNPLTDISHVRGISGVCVNGRWLDRSALDALLNSTRH